MKYDVVIIPESFHKFDKHNMEHICPPMVIGDRSYDIAMEIVNGVDRVIRANFNASVEELEGEDCDVLYRKYTLEKDGRKGIVHVKLRRIAENCPPVDGNRCSVLEFERDVECIVEAIEECLE
ncbi:hypothetical protein [Thermococcus sp. 21S9]|uniref:hypothetical protein n=1 Tax=Thermococcus sp. 21S9 TaxID=1638223 RepID=UPI001439E489|nr:hypothetical protein [Thermococcus sp. 21S9]NJE53625.1 hypothetical protein [Thermococcus sp. 21S9]